jgi:hypothetical protein
MNPESYVKLAPLTEKRVKESNEEMISINNFFIIKTYLQFVQIVDIRKSPEKM